MGNRSSKDEFVTYGSVSLREINLKTIESRPVPGLHFAGECIDYDETTGSFNFQVTWTTGHIAGTPI
jgi:predicted flavoprotein YhiN